MKIVPELMFMQMAKTKSQSDLTPIGWWIKNSEGQVGLIKDKSLFLNSLQEVEFRISGLSLFHSVTT